MQPQHHDRMPPPYLQSFFALYTPSVLVFGGWKLARGSLNISLVLQKWFLNQVRGRGRLLLTPLLASNFSHKSGQHLLTNGLGLAGSLWLVSKGDHAVLSNPEFAIPIYAVSGFLGMTAARVVQRHRVMHLPFRKAPSILGASGPVLTFLGVGCLTSGIEFGEAMWQRSVFPSWEGIRSTFSTAELAKSLVLLATVFSTAGTVRALLGYASKFSHESHLVGLLLCYPLSIIAPPRAVEPAAS